jgi:hypothetical protein
LKKFQIKKKKTNAPPLPELAPPSTLCPIHRHPLPPPIFPKLVSLFPPKDGLFAFEMLSSNVSFFAEKCGRPHENVGIVLFYFLFFHRLCLMTILHNFGIIRLFDKIVESMLRPESVGFGSYLFACVALRFRKTRSVGFASFHWVRKASPLLSSLDDLCDVNDRIQFT